MSSLTVGAGSIGTCSIGAVCKSKRDADCDDDTLDHMQT